MADLHKIYDEEGNALSPQLSDEIKNYLMDID